MSNVFDVTSWDESQIMDEIASWVRLLPRSMVFFTNLAQTGNLPQFITRKEGPDGACAVVLGFTGTGMLIYDNSRQITERFENRKYLSQDRNQRHFLRTPTYQYFGLLFC